MSVADRIVSAARALCGVPFVHQGRNPKTGLDCVGLLVEVAKREGLQYDDREVYPVTTDGEALFACLRVSCEQVEDGVDVRPGDIVVFLRGRGHWHAGIVETMDPDSMVHAWGRRGGDGLVRSEPLAPEWLRRLHSVWRYREVPA